MQRKNRFLVKDVLVSVDNPSAVLLGKAGTGHLDESLKVHRPIKQEVS